MQNHGNAPAAQSIVSGGKVIQPDNPVESGFTFEGWYKDADCTTPWIFTFDTVTRATTIYAKWTQISTVATSVTYMITYDYSGEANTDSLPTEYVDSTGEATEDEVKNAIVELVNEQVGTDFEAITTTSIAIAG